MVVLEWLQDGKCRDGGGWSLGRYFGYDSPTGATGCHWVNFGDSEGLWSLSRSYLGVMGFICVVYLILMYLCSLVLGY